MTFTDAQLDTIANALNVAAMQFEIDAQVCERMVKEGYGGHERTAAQFRQQAKEATALADAIDQRD